MTFSVREFGKFQALRQERDFSIRPIVFTVITIYDARHSHSALKCTTYAFRYHILFQLALLPAVIFVMDAVVWVLLCKSKHLPEHS
jgi:hypothetical protein